jgi:endogenous inhibitor of DNA gyrase (YacG/DUF329 family)
MSLKPLDKCVTCGEASLFSILFPDGDRYTFCSYQCVIDRIFWYMDEKQIERAITSMQVATTQELVTIIINEAKEDGIKDINEFEMWCRKKFNIPSMIKFNKADIDG